MVGVGQARQEAGESARRQLQSGMRGMILMVTKGMAVGIDESERWWVQGRDRRSW